MSTYPLQDEKNYEPGYVWNPAAMEEMSSPVKVILLMGVAGSGKTTIGKALASAVGWQFKDADDFHSIANRDKMHQGVPLDDRDRQPWLHALQQAIFIWLQTDSHTILACSALKSAYRYQLKQQSEQVQYVYLKGSIDLIKQRLQHRPDHYMSPELLASQFDILEEPDNALSVDISQSPEDILHQIKTHFRLEDEPIGLTQISEVFTNPKKL